MNAEFLHKLSYQQLAEQFDLLATDATEYAVFLLDENGQVLCWNEGAVRLFGYRSPEVVGQNFSLLFSAEDIRDGQPEHEIEVALSEGRVDSARWQLKKNGQPFWCKSTLTPLRNVHKQFRSFARVMHDLSDIQTQQAQIKRADDLEEANRNKEEFLALISHELRNPLAPILNALSILQEMKTVDPIVEQAGNIINRQVQLMIHLVDDLLDINRISTGKLRLTKERVELCVIANHAAEASRPLMDSQRHDFSLSLPTAPVWVEADPTRLEQIIVNLLNNAAKCTEVGGLIRLSIQEDGPDAVVQVRDNGVGIAPTMLPSIFNLFTQVEGSFSRSYGGLGIGLALVRSLVELQDGRVQAQSDGIGKGSTFTVKLPLMSAQSKFPIELISASRDQHLTHCKSAK